MYGVWWFLLLLLLLLFLFCWNYIIIGRRDLDYLLTTSFQVVFFIYYYYFNYYFLYFILFFFWLFRLLLFVVVKRRGGTIDRNNISIVNSTFRDEPHPHGDFRFIICCFVSLRSLLVMMLLPDCYTQYSINSSLCISLFLIDSFLFFLTLYQNTTITNNSYVSTFFFTAIHYDIVV